jgi:hypothetical protein
MNTKIITGGIIGGIISFLLGWLIYGTLLKDYFSKNMISYDHFFKEPPILWALALGSLSLGMLVAYILGNSNNVSASRGLIAGGIVYFLATLGFDLFMYAQMNLFGRKLMVIDVAASTIMGAIVGFVAGWWMGRGKAVPAVAA